MKAAASERGAVAPCDPVPGPGPQAWRAWLARPGIDAANAALLYVGADGPACTEHGFEPGSRVEVAAGGASVTAQVNVVAPALLGPDEAGLFEAAWARLGVPEGSEACIRRAPPARSFARVRSKIYGGELSLAAATEIVADIAAGLYSDIEIASFITTCAGKRLHAGEVIALTGAMVRAGTRLAWPRAPVVDKHCVGGLPGNRTTLLVVPIVAACSLLIPKTSSRAITSPAGSADAMETLAPVALDIAAMRRVVEREGGCIVWGGAVNPSPADDMLIRVARPLDFDGEANLVASVLSKKLAAGSSHVLIDIPVGPSAKVRSQEAAASLDRLFGAVAQACGLAVRTIATDGRQPVGRGIGPSLEALDARDVLNDAPGSPGVLFHAPIGTRVVPGQPLLTVHAAAPGALAQALAYAAAHDGIIGLTEEA